MNTREDITIREGIEARNNLEQQIKKSLIDLINNFNHEYGLTVQGVEVYFVEQSSIGSKYKTYQLSDVDVSISLN